MLYMIVSRHTPEACPMINEASLKKMVSAYQRMGDVAKKLGVTPKGTWTDMPAHTIFMLLDSPTAEALGQMAMELNLVDWNTSVTHPVVTFEQAMATVQQLK